MIKGAPDLVIRGLLGGQGEPWGSWILQAMSSQPQWLVCVMQSTSTQPLAPTFSNCSLSISRVWSAEHGAADAAGAGMGSKPAFLPFSFSETEARAGSKHDRVPAPGSRCHVVTHNIATKRIREGGPQSFCGVWL